MGKGPENTQKWGAPLSTVPNCPPKSAWTFQISSDATCNLQTVTPGNDPGGISRLSDRWMHTTLRPSSLDLPLCILTGGGKSGLQE